MLAKGECESRTPPSHEAHETWMDTNPLLYFQLSIVVAISPFSSVSRLHFVGVGIIIKVQCTTPKKTMPVRIPCIILAHTLGRCVELFLLDFISFYLLFFFGPQIVKRKIPTKFVLNALFSLD